MDTHTVSIIDTTYWNLGDKTLQQELAGKAAVALGVVGFEDEIKITIDGPNFVMTFVPAVREVVKRIFTVIYEHRSGHATYVFTMDIPEGDPEFPGDWVPALDHVVKALDIHFEPWREESIEIISHGTVDMLQSIEASAEDLRADNYKKE